MKKHLVTGSLALVLAGSLITSCKDETRPRDSKEAATEQNEEKLQTDSSQAKAAFAVEAASDNLAGMKLAQLAIARSSNKEIKDLARAIGADHTEALGQLKSIASVKGIILPTDEPDKTKDLVKDLDKDQPAAFDRNWEKGMMDKQEKMISNYERALKDLKDEDLTAWINKLLPRLRIHHDKLMILHSKITK